MRISTRDLTLAAMVAALYAVMSYFGNIFGLTFGIVQFRFAEALTVLPYLFPTTVPGLFIGCLITNLLSPYGPMDIVIGSAATLIAALWTAHMPNQWLAPLPPVICNAVMVGFTIAWAETGGFTPAFPMAWTIKGGSLAVEEAVVCYLLGSLLLSALPKLPFFRRMIPEERLSAV